MSFVAIEKDFQAKVSEKVCLAAEGLILARFSDVCEKQYSNLAGNRDRIERYLDEVMSNGVVG